MWCVGVLLCLGLTLSGVHAVPLTNPASCASDTDCSAKGPFAVCKAGRCECDSVYGYFRKGSTDSCIYHAQMGETCGEHIECQGANVGCYTDGANNGRKRCQCNVSFKKYKINPAPAAGSDPFACGEIIYKALSAECTDCETNEGTCVDTNTGNGYNMDYCVCPSYRSGSDCGTAHVSIECDLPSFSMTVCYTPQAGYTFNTLPNSAVLVSDGHGQDEACKGNLLAANSAPCTATQVMVTYPLDNAHRHRCGTKKVFSDVTTQRYENTIVVQKNAQEMDQTDVSFTTYCSFDTHASKSFKAVGLFVMNKNEKGTHKEPQLTMGVQNILGQPIAPGVALRLGDKIRLTADLVQDGTYEAIKVVRCSASTSANIPNPNAVTIPLVTAGCPYSGQSYFTLANKWRLVNGNPSDLQTGFIEMFKLSSARSVHIHCTLQLCLVGDTSGDCNVPSCARRKRAARLAPESRHGQMAMLHTELKWYDENDTPVDTSKAIVYKKIEEEDNYTYMMVLGGLGLLVVLAMVFAGVVYSKLRRAKAEEETDRITLTAATRHMMAMPNPMVGTHKMAW